MEQEESKKLTVPDGAKIRVRAVTDIETLPNGKTMIIVTELPYLVNKARLIEKIAELVRDKKIDGITDS